MADNAAEPFTMHAVVEVMGHKRLAGWVSEQTIGGTAFVRVDVPQTAKRPPWTKFLGAAAIYAITPCSEEVARLVAEQEGRYEAPVAVDLPPQAKLTASTVADDYDDDVEVSKPW